MNARGGMVALLAIGCLGCSLISGLEDFSTVNIRESETSAGGNVGAGGTGGTANGAAGGGGGSAGGGGAMLIMLQLPITADDRDAWDDEINGNFTQCRISDSVYRDACGLMWQLAIPAGANIEEASLSVQSLQHIGNAATYQVEIRVEDTATPLAFAGTPNDIKTRSYWTTTVPWTIPDGGLPIDQSITTPAITELIQHVVSMPGWQSGGDVSLAIWGVQDNAGSADDLYDSSVDAARGVVLDVTYRAP